MKRKKPGDLKPPIDLEKMNVAHHLISKGFPDVIRDTYLRGKTEFRRFRKGMRYGTWGIRNKP